MIEKGILNVGDLKIRIYIDPIEPEYLQFMTFECEDKQMDALEEIANSILTAPLENIV